MSLANEAAYLYVYSLKLRTVHTKIDKTMKKVKKYAHHYKEASAENKPKYQEKYRKSSKKLRELFQKQHQLTLILRHHHTAFAHQMNKEHKTIK